MVSRENAQRQPPQKSDIGKKKSRTNHESKNMKDSQAS
jgi:hypothetical protein